MGEPTFRLITLSHSGHVREPINYACQALWLAGLMCVILASLGDLVALYFAKPSLIAPIGSVNLAANVVISPLMLGPGSLVLLLVHSFLCFYSST
jgi:hypothetical protein